MCGGRSALRLFCTALLFRVLRWWEGEGMHVGLYFPVIVRERKIKRMSIMVPVLMQSPVSCQV